MTLNSHGRRLLEKHHTLKVTLHVTQAISARQVKAISTQKLTFRAPRRHR